MDIARWLLVESIRHLEKVNGPIDDQAAVLHARGAGGDFNQRLAHRAEALPVSQEIQQEIAAQLGKLKTAVWVFFVLSFFLGAIAAITSLSSSQVNFLWAFLSLLLLPTIMLLLWGVILSRPPGGAGPGQTISGILRAILKLSGKLWGANPPSHHVTDAFEQLTKTPLAKAFFSTLAHVGWMLYVLSALITLSVLFAVAQYDLVWETTILADETVERIFRVIAAGPAMLGISPSLDTELISSAREGMLTEAVRRDLAWLFIGAIIAYGLLPRLILAVGCGAWWYWASSRLTFDTDLPGYVQLRPRLIPKAAHDRTMGEAPAGSEARKRQRAKNASGAPILIAVELQDPEPFPGIVGIHTQPAGRADTREQRKQIEAVIDARQPPAPALIALCSILRTTDTGTESFLNRLADRANAPLVIVLDEQGKMKTRESDIAARIADWETLATRTGAELVIYDRQQPDTTSLSRIAKLSGANGEEP